MPHRKMEERLSVSESIASTMLLAVGLITLARGSYWTLNPNSESDSQMYASLASVMPLWAWALGFVIGGLLLVLASWYLPRRALKNRFDWLLLIGGMTSSASYFIVAVAGFGNAANWLTPVQLVIYSIATLVLAFYGGFSLWRKKSMY